MLSRPKASHTLCEPSSCSTKFIPTWHQSGPTHLSEAPGSILECPVWSTTDKVPPEMKRTETATKLHSSPSLQSSALQMQPSNSLSPFHLQHKSICAHQASCLLSHILGPAPCPSNFPSPFHSSQQDCDDLQHRHWPGSISYRLELQGRTELKELKLKVPCGTEPTRPLTE